MTEKLYNQDSMLNSFTAVVLECSCIGEKWEVVLDRTAFFPEGGGQSSDTGYLLLKENRIPVLDVQERNGVICHYTEQELQKGDQVKGVLDFEERFSKMQQHSGEHIVSGLASSRFGCRNVGFHLGSDLVTMDYDKELSKQQLRELEMEANRAVARNIPIEIQYPSEKELENLQYRSKIEIEGQVRIVQIPGYDTCACCAPHVKSTGSIGIIKLTGVIRYKGGIRVTMVCGLRALQDYNSKEENISAIANRLSVPADETSEAVLRLEKEILGYKEKIKQLTWRYVQLRLEQIDNSEEDVLLFEEEMDAAAMRKFVNDGMEKTKGICGIFAGNENVGYQYILGSKGQDILAVSKALNQACSGKGGGKPPMVQGFLQGEETLIRKVIEQV